MAAQVEQGATRRAQGVPLLAVFLAGLVVGPMLTSDDQPFDRTPVWSDVVHVDGEPFAAELIPKGDRELPYGYELCASPPGGSHGDGCVQVTDSNGIDARLDETPSGDLLIVLSGADRPLSVPNGVEVPFGARNIQGVLVRLDLADGDCVSFRVPDPAGGTGRMSVWRTIGEPEGELVSWTFKPVSSYGGGEESCHRLS